MAGEGFEDGYKAREEVADIFVLTSSHSFPDNESDMSLLVGIHLGS